MITIDHLPHDEQKHFILCACGHYVDMRDLSSVFDHFHSERSAEPKWSYAVRKGEASAYPRNGQVFDLN